MMINDSCRTMKCSDLKTSSSCESDGKDEMRKCIWFDNTCKEMECIDHKSSLSCETKGSNGGGKCIWINNLCNDLKCWDLTTRTSCETDGMIKGNECEWFNGKCFKKNYCNDFSIDSCISHTERKCIPYDNECRLNIIYFLFLNFLIFFLFF
jgi:hypothetical protein